MSKRKKSTKADIKAKKLAKKAAPAKPSGAIFAEIKKAAGDKKIVLHIGCGTKKKEKLHKRFQGEEWFELRLDIDASVSPDIISDMTNMDDVPDESVDAIWSSHNVEHLYPHVVPEALKEFNRVIKPEGFVFVTMPDIQTVATHVAHGNLEEPIYESPAGPICAIDIMYGLRASMSRGNLYMAHKTAFTAKTLATHLRDAGFSNIKVSRDWIDLWGLAFKFPHGHPQRIEKIEIHENNKSRLNPPEALPLQKTQHPGRINGRPTDFIDIPPKLDWQPLNLKSQ